MLEIYEIYGVFKNALFYIDGYIDFSDYLCLQKIQIDIKADIITIVKFIILSNCFIFYFCFADLEKFKFEQILKYSIEILFKHIVNHYEYDKYQCYYYL